MKLNFTSAILFLLLSIASATAYPHPPLIARERVPYTDTPYPGTRVPPPKQADPGTSVTSTPVASPPPAPPCGLPVTFKVFTRNVPSNAPYILLVAGELLENGKQVCDIYDFVEPSVDGFERLLCEPGYMGFFNFRTLSGKLWKEGHAERLLEWDRAKGGLRDGEFVSWEWEGEVC